MKARRHLALWVVVLLGVSVQAEARGKKKVLVLDFDSTAVQQSVQTIFGSDVNVGRGLSDLVAQYLNVDGTYESIGRDKLEKVLAKTEFANLNFSDPASLRSLGKAVRADAVLVGRVTHFGWGKRGRARRKNSNGRKALVLVDARLIVVRTGEVLSAARGSGASSRAGTALLEGKKFKGFGNGTADFSRGDFQSTLLGSAVIDVVDTLGNVMLDAREKLGARGFSVTAQVLSVNGPEAVLNVGQGLGLKVGKRLPVIRETGEVKDRASGVVLRKLTRRVAVVEVVAMDDLAVVTRVVSGGGVRVGDGVKIVMN